MEKMLIEDVRNYMLETAENDAYNFIEGSSDKKMREMCDWLYAPTWDYCGTIDDALDYFEEDDLDWDDIQNCFSFDEYKEAADKAFWRILEEWEEEKKKEKEQEIKDKIEALTDEERKDIRKKIENEGYQNIDTTFEDHEGNYYNILLEKDDFWGDYVDTLNYVADSLDDYDLSANDLAKYIYPFKEFEAYGAKCLEKIRKEYNNR